MFFVCDISFKFAQSDESALKNVSLSSLQEQVQMTKKKLVTCSPYMLLMGYEYEYKKDRMIYNKQYKRKKKNESI